MAKSDQTRIRHDAASKVPDAITSGSIVLSANSGDVVIIPIALPYSLKDLKKYLRLPSWARAAFQKRR